MGKLFEELKRRKVFRVAVVYALVAWVLIQIADVVLPTFEAPTWVNQTLIFLFIIGFPLALILAWAYEIGPEGVRPDPGAQVSLATQSTPNTDHKLIYATFALVLVVAGIQITDRFATGTDGTVSRRQEGGMTGAAQIIRSSINLGNIEKRVVVGLRSDVALSPDGTLLAYTGQTNNQVKLFIKDLTNSDPATILTGNGDDVYPIAPMFSPSGDYILYVRFGFNELHAIPSRGGRSISVTSLANNGVGGNWLDDDTIIFTHNEDRSLHSIPLNGSESVSLGIPVAPGGRQSWPQRIPDTDWLLYTVNDSDVMDLGHIDAYNLATGEIKTLINNAYNSRYASSGHVVFTREGDLWAVPFDPVDAATLGEETLIERGIEHYSLSFGKAAYSFSENGRLAYLEGFDGISVTGGNYLVRSGNGDLTSLELPSGAFRVQISPNGRYISTGIVNPVDLSAEVSVYDIEEETLTQRTFGESAGYAIWTPDGLQLVYASKNDDGWTIWAINADGSGQPERLVSSTQRISPASFSPDGSQLVFLEGNFASGANQVKVLDINNDESPVTTLQLDGSDLRPPRISPDGKWLAYISNALGGWDVFVTPFPNVEEGKWRISYEGARNVVWGSNSDKIYFLNTSLNSIDRVELNIQSGFSTGPARRVVDGVPWAGFRSPVFDIFPDGDRILYRTTTETSSSFTAQPTSLTLVENWFEKLRELAPPDSD